MIRFSCRYRRQIIHVSTSMAAVLLFCVFPAAMLLHLGSTDVSGPAGRVPSCHAMSSEHLLTKQGPPDPGSIASGADPELCVDDI